jgi:hypothetical protein
MERWGWSSNEASFPSDKSRWLLTGSERVCVSKGTRAISINKIGQMEKRAMDRRLRSCILALRQGFIVCPAERAEIGPVVSSCWRETNRATELANISPDGETLGMKVLVTGLDEAKTFGRGDGE